MESDRTAFLRAIAAEPNDDTARLIFADWLDEHGEAAQAEFIRVQCEQEQVDDTTEAAYRLARRERELLAQHRTAWEAEVRQLVIGPPVARGIGQWLQSWFDPPLRPTVTPSFDWPFRRGFLSEVRLSVRRAIKLGNELARLAPFDALRLTVGDGMVEHFRQLASGPLIAQMRSLNLTEAADPSWLRLLVRSAPHLADLTLTGRKVSDVPGRSFPDQLDALRRTELPGRLANLRFYEWEAASDWWSESVAEQLAQLGGSSLRKLTLRRVGLSSAAARALLADARLTGLEELDVSQSESSAGLAAALIAGPARPALRKLDLTENTAWSLQQGEALAAWPGLASLTHLAVDDIGRMVRAAAGAGPELLELRLSGRVGGCRPADLAHFLERPAASNLRRLDLSGQYRLGAAGMDLLAKSPQLASLLDLRLGGCMAGDAAPLLLATSPHLGNLRRLDLSFNNITSVGVRSLLSADWPHLSELILGGNPELSRGEIRRLRGKWATTVVTD
jgi:uncharacterized protein (TIGR02996 family)